VLQLQLWSFRWPPFNPQIANLFVHHPFYPATNDLIINFIASRMKKEIPEIERYGNFAEKVVVLAGSLLGLIESIMLDLIKAYGYLVIEPA
jgi:hypothetical protein